MTHRPFNAVIMAGGKGPRLWPDTTPTITKQLRDLERTGRTPRQSAYDRALPLTGGPQDIRIDTDSPTLRRHSVALERLLPCDAAPPSWWYSSGAS